MNENKYPSIKKISDVFIIDVNDLNKVIKKIYGKEPMHFTESYNTKNEYIVCLDITGNVDDWQKEELCRFTHFGGEFCCKSMLSFLNDLVRKEEFVKGNYIVKVYPYRRY